MSCRDNPTTISFRPFAWPIHRPPWIWDGARSPRRAEWGADFHVERYVNKWPAKKHEHFLIPAGTIHCSGRDCMVLEISATPYIFTFKMWDWARLGLDGHAAADPSRSWPSQY
jgi:hypothetical protein